ncbi:MAG: tetrahydrofolate dehydrogenase/cyclohydrolase catalytic domain-containing protein, partial [Haloglomus sp.]
MTTVIDGDAVAEGLRGELSECVETLKRSDVRPSLATVLMSEDPASETYVSMKQRDCEELGIE